MTADAKRGVDVQTEQTRSVVERLAEVFTTKSVDGLDEIVAESVVCHSLAAGGPRGREMYRQLISWVDHTIGNARWDVLSLLADGDRAVLHVRLSGRHTGHFLGVPPTGREFSAEQVYIYRVRDGMVTDYWLVRDDVEALLQIGAIQPSWQRARPA
jgi:predicted ester cyclase